MRKLIIACMLLVSSMSFANPPTKFHVGILEIKNNEGVAKVAVAIWRRLEHQFNLDAQFHTFHNQEKAFAALQHNKIDIIVGPVKVQTSRPGVLFLSSYITDEVGVFVPYKPPSTWQHLLYLLRMFGSSIIIFSVCMLILVGFLVWLCERRHNPQFSKGFLKGIGDGIWFALVSMTTVGYGDKAPLTFMGRFITTVWMLITIVMLSSIIALVTAEITGAKLMMVDKLNMSSFSGRKVVYIKGDSKEDKEARDLAKHYHYRSVVVDTLAQAIKMLNEREVDAGLLNRINTRYYLFKHPGFNVQITKLTFPVGRYAFAISSYMKKATQFDQALLLMEDTGILSKIEESALGFNDDLARHKMKF